MYQTVWKRELSLPARGEGDVQTIIVPNMFPVESGCVVALTAFNGHYVDVGRDVSLLSALARLLAVMGPPDHYAEEGAVVERQTKVPDDATEDFVEWFRKENFSSHCFRYRIGFVPAASFPLPVYEYSVCMGVEIQDASLAPKVMKRHCTTDLFYAFCFQLGARNIMPAPTSWINYMGLCFGAMEGTNLALLQFILQLSNDPGIVGHRAALFAELFHPHNRNALGTVDGPPVLESFFLQLDGQKVSGVGVVDIGMEVRSALFQCCAFNLSPQRSTVMFRGQQRNALYFARLAVEASPEDSVAWLVLAFNMKSEKTVSLRLPEMAEPTLWTVTACSIKAVQLNLNSSHAWNNLAWYAHCEGLKEVVVGLETRSTIECAVLSLCLEPNQPNNWGTLGTILGSDGWISRNQVSAMEFPWLEERQALFVSSTFSDCEAFDAMGCFERQMQLAVTTDRDLGYSFLNIGLLLGDKNRARNAPADNTIMFFAPPNSAVLSDLILKLTPSSESLANRAVLLASLVMSPSCKLSEHDCYELALAFNEEDVLGLVFTSLPHHTRRFLDCVGELLSSTGMRIVRKYSI